MNAPDEAVMQKVKQWMSYADEDLRLARHAIAMEDEAPTRLIAYHAQQCAEKYLKSYLISCGVDFPYTHNIARLLELCIENGGVMENLSDAEELTPYAITARYPGEDEDVSSEEATRAIEIAERVRQVVRGILADY